MAANETTIVDCCNSNAEKRFKIGYVLIIQLEIFRVFVKEYCDGSDLWTKANFYNWNPSLFGLFKSLGQGGTPIASTALLDQSQRTDDMEVAKNSLRDGLAYGLHHVMVCLLFAVTCFPPHFISLKREGRNFFIPSSKHTQETQSDSGKDHSKKID
ncbi:hypothetical protein [Bacillus weihaiensis]|uniref:Uncharacterized protein n=1 Tax=Bacillus weihaiensis TaxID=1547283 RepID=A0A1L3MT19_9BACI|nr:hypothetical protein [Bacillus weihaiensis]APH05476.1 hypothetical protein A9C19_12330 [Bacillus weihaiensis]